MVKFPRLFELWSFYSCLFNEHWIKNCLLFIVRNFHLGKNCSRRNLVNNNWTLWKNSRSKRTERIIVNYFNFVTKSNGITIRDDKRQIVREAPKSRVSAGVLQVGRRLTQIQQMKTLSQTFEKFNQKKDDNIYCPFRSKNLTLRTLPRHDNYCTLPTNVYLPINIFFSIINT